MEDFESTFESQITAETFGLIRKDLTKARGKTSQRLKYEAETRVLKQEIGGLEDLRIRLGLSRRKICQLLLVDPSAWTRWTGENSDAPPHIYRSLKWYLDSKGHELTKIDKQLNELRTENYFLQKDLKAIRSQMARFRLIFYALFLSLIVSAVGAVFWLVTSRAP